MPVWQALREELKGLNFEVITVACDTKGREAVAQWLAAARPSHPSLIDQRHVVPDLFNTRNVPAAFWIDETGRIVRANDPIYVRRRNQQTGDTTINERYLDAIRDWVRNGAASVYVTRPETTAQRIGASDAENEQAKAYFRLGLYLHAQGHAEDAILHFKRAHALKPENWNLKRQAWNLGDLERDYGLTIQQAYRGGIPLYPPLDLSERT